MGAFSQGLTAGTNALNSRKNRELGERGMAVQEQGIALQGQGQEFDQGQKVLQNYRTQAEKAASLASELIQKGGPATREKAMKMLEMTKSQFAEVESKAGYRPGTLTSILDMTAMTPTQREIMQQQGAAEGAGKVAKAQEIAPAAGVTQKEALGFSDEKDSATAAQKKYKDLVDNGVDEMTALAAANGLLDTSTNSKTGEITIINPLSGEAKTVKQGYGGEKINPETGRAFTDKQVASQKGKKKVTTILKTLADSYQNLSDAGAAIDTTQPWYKNLFAYVRSSEPSQAVEKSLGTDSQSIRNRIAQTKPLLINAIRQASEMGARGMDSEKELKFYLQAATDPTTDIQSNIEALKVLDKAYGLDMGLSDDSSNNVDLKKLKDKYGLE